MEQLQKSAYSIAPPPTSASPKMTSPRGRLEFSSVSHSRSSINVHGSVIAMPAASADGTGTRIWMCHLQHKRTPPPQLLDGFADRTGPKHYNTTAFPQDGEADSKQPRRKPPRSAEPMAKSAPVPAKPPRSCGRQARGQDRGSRND